MIALNACPQPPDMSSMSMCEMFIFDLSVSLRLSMVTPDDAALVAACVSVSAAMGVERSSVLLESCLDGCTAGEAASLGNDEARVRKLVERTARASWTGSLTGMKD